MVEEAVLTVGAPEPVTSSWELLEHPHTPKTKWSISKALALELAEHLEQTGAKRILEIGSGFSTVILAAYAARHEDVRVVSLEHSKRYEERTRQGLKRLGLASDRVDLKLANLREHKFPNGERHLWYDLRNARVDEKFDFVFVDGPPKRQGRWGVFFGLADHLSPGWEMWVDDGLRQHEKKCIKLWKQHLQFTHEREDIDGKGLWTLRDSGQPAPAPDERPPGKLGIVIMANGDPGWRQRTTSWVDPRRLEESFVLAATEDDTREPDGSFVDARVPRTGRRERRLPERMLQSVARRPDVEFVLYLNDDWRSQAIKQPWLERALRYLQANPQVDQVYLRRRIDQDDRRVNPSVDGMGFVERATTPYGEEPCLIRASSLPLLGVIKRARATESRAVQLSPGVFLENGKGRRAGAGGRR